MRVLDDGEWHPLQNVLHEMTKEIPPTTAMNYYRTRQRKTARGKPKQLHTVAQQIRAAKYGMARKVLIDWSRTGRVEVDPPGWRVPDKRVRLVRGDA